MSYNFIDYSIITLLAAESNYNRHCAKYFICIISYI